MRQTADPLRVAVVIPARMGSSRFPGKPLAPIGGYSMIEHVYRRSMMASGIEGVYVATCDLEIEQAARSFGAPVIMTSVEHQRASDRVAEAAGHIKADVVVMVQGDEPMLHPDMIATAVAPFRDAPDVLCVNLVARIRTLEEFEDRNTIKVAIGANGDALYFSRESIPSVSLLGFEQISGFKQVCVIPFAVAALRKFAELPPTPLEQVESIDMLRFLEHGVPIRTAETDIATHAVDTPEDLAYVESLMKDDPLVRMYRAAPLGAS